MPVPVYSPLKRTTYIVGYLCCYPFLWLLILAEYIPTRLWHGYTRIWVNWGVLAGIFSTLAITGSLFTGIPLIVLWILGKKSYYSCYEKAIGVLHADWYRYAKPA